VLSLCSQVSKKTALDAKKNSAASKQDGDPGECGEPSKERFAPYSVNQQPEGRTPLLLGSGSGVTTKIILSYEKQRILGGRIRAEERADRGPRASG